MSNGFVYIGSPYSHPDASVRENRFEAVCAKSARLMMQGYTVFSPIAHSHPIAKHLPESLLMNNRFWMKQDLPILQFADKLIVLTLDGWQYSKGLAEERKYADEIGIEIEFHDMEGIVFSDEAWTSLDHIGARAN